jgi:hypothetical protein
VDERLLDGELYRHKGRQEHHGHVIAFLEFAIRRFADGTCGASRLVSGAARALWAAAKKALGTTGGHSEANLMRRSLMVTRVPDLEELANSFG